MDSCLYSPIIKEDRFLISWDLDGGESFIAISMIAFLIMVAEIVCYVSFADAAWGSC